MNLGLIYNIVLKGFIGNDINSISNELRTYTVSATPRRKIFFSEYIFIKVKLLPHKPPTLKPIPIPPSRPNDLKHIAIDY